jgi:hypothetical protein
MHFSTGATSKWLFVPRFSRLWVRITSWVNLIAIEGLKQSCSPRRKLSNDMTHITRMKGNWIDSRLLVVENQIADFSFGHNLCYMCSNGRCEPISNIYASIAFQWYKDLFKAMSFDPCNRALKIQKSFWDSNSQHGSSLGSMRVHAFTLFALMRVCDVTPRFLSWPAPL